MITLAESRLFIIKEKYYLILTSLAIILAPCQTEYLKNGFSVTLTSIGAG